MIIAFTGCDGSGKSTQVKKVKEWLEAENYEVEILDKWDVMNHVKFPECSFVKQDLNELRVCISEMNGISRAMFLFWSISITLSRNSINDPHKIYLLDGYWMKHAVSEILYGCPEDWVIETIKTFPLADLTIYLDVQPELALSRKTDFTPYECGRKVNFTSDDFLTHQRKLHKEMLVWAEQHGWEKISSNQTVDDIFSKIKTKIQRLIV